MAAVGLVAASWSTDASAEGSAKPPFVAASCAVPATAPAVAAPASMRVGGRTPGGERIGPRLAAQVTRNDRADVTFEVRPAASGAIDLIARRGDLEVTKRVQPNGEFTLEIAAGKDRVAIGASGRGSSVSRGKTRVSLPRAGETEVVSTGARRLLAESNAVVKFRALTAALLADEDRSPAATAMIVADAAIGVLSGDVGAPGRAAQYLGRKGRGPGRRAALAVDCFALMETRFVEAWNDYANCWASTIANPIYQNLCAWRWTLQVESYWFSFISCSGFSGNW